MQSSGLLDNSISSFVMFNDIQCMISHMQLGNSHGYYMFPSLKTRCTQSRHVFHLVDARNHKLLPGDKQLLHLLAKAQRRSVRYTIVTGLVVNC